MPVVKPAASTPCSACPWRLANHGKPHPHGWYTKKNLRRLWGGLRTGEAPGMSCHPTDPNNEVPEGHKAPKDGAEPAECAGALLLVKRELQLFQADPVAYKRERRPGKLTLDGLRWWVLARAGPFAGTPMGGPAMRDVPETADVGRP